MFKCLEQHFEEPIWPLKILQRSLKICKFLLKQLLTTVSFTDLKIGSHSRLLNGFSNRILKNAWFRILCKDDLVAGLI